MSSTTIAGQAAVIGGGTMGAGIAHVLLRAGYDVVVFDRDEETASRAERSVRDALAAERSWAREHGREVHDCPGDLRHAVWGDAGVDDCSVIVEAVPEIVGLKTEVLGAASRAMVPGALLASNTSSLSIDELATAVARPEDVVGMHFFNPVPRSNLVEIVRGARTSESTLRAAHDLADALGLTAIEVRDSPGFATSRLGVALGLEAIRMAEDGVASAEDIDTAMVLGYKHPIGPLRLTDLIGLDVRLDIARHLADELGPRFNPPDLLVEMVEDGRLGKKSGQGFYTW